MPPPRLFHFDVACFAAPYGSAAPSAAPTAKPVTLLRVAVLRRATVEDILAKLASHTAAPEGLRFRVVAVKGGALLEPKAILEDVIREQEEDLEAFTGDETKKEPIDEIILRLAKRLELNVDLPARKAKTVPDKQKDNRKPYGAVKRIVATTKEYVESLQFFLRRGSPDEFCYGKCENADAQGILDNQLKKHVFYLQEDELLQEAQQVVVADAPPRTLGVELLLRTSQRELRISGEALRRPVLPGKVSRNLVKAPAGRQIQSLVFFDQNLIGNRNQRSLPKLVKKRAKRSRKEKSISDAKRIRHQ